jgi:hypothetical protein
VRIKSREPDLDLRPRKAGWLISRISAETAVHDIARSRFGQWWKRSGRGGRELCASLKVHLSVPARQAQGRRPASAMARSMV